MTESKPLSEEDLEALSKEVLDARETCHRHRLYAKDEFPCQTNDCAGIKQDEADALIAEVRRLRANDGLAEAYAQLRADMDLMSPEMGRLMDRLTASESQCSALRRALMNLVQDFNHATTTTAYSNGTWCREVLAEARAALADSGKGGEDG